MLLNDANISSRMLAAITPFLGNQVRQMENGTKVLSFGLSSCGYDVRLSAEAGLKVFSPEHYVENIGLHERAVIDPKKFNPGFLRQATLHTDPDGSRYWLLPPHSYALGATVETFKMPADLAGLCLGKSTLARCGLIVNATPLEPGWEGQLVLELANSTGLPMRVYAEEGVAQVLFSELKAKSAAPYGKDRKYQFQKGVVLAKV